MITDYLSYLSDLQKTKDLLNEKTLTAEQKNIHKASGQKKGFLFFMRNIIIHDRRASNWSKINYFE